MSKHTVKDVLRMVGHLLENPKRRAEGWYARDDDGLEISSSSPRATCFCLAGAITASAQALGLSYDTCAPSARNILSTAALADHWDMADDDGRDAIAAKLRAA